MTIQEDPTPTPRLNTEDVFQVQTNRQLTDILQSIEALKRTLQTLSETLATHIAQNIGATQQMSDYIGEQMSYRLFRQGLEENNLSLQLAQRNLELEFLEKRYKALEGELREESEESVGLAFERDKQKLEIETLKRNLDLLQVAKRSTNEKIKAIVPPVSLSTRMRDTFVLSTIGTLTAAAVGGTIAFVVWLVRLYITSNP